MNHVGYLISKRFFHSLENFSDKIRWSFDLRYQTPHKTAAFHDVKEHVLFKSSKDPNHEIDWEGWNKIDRTVTQMKAVEKRMKEVAPGTSWHSEVKSWQE